MKIITYEHKSVNEQVGTRMTDVAFDWTTTTDRLFTF